MAEQASAGATHGKCVAFMTQRFADSRNGGIRRARYRVTAFERLSEKIARPIITGHFLCHVCHQHYIVAKGNAAWRRAQRRASVRGEAAACRALEKQLLQPWDRDEA
ncbi:hypothetical protein [Caballeronia novacaledonica]|uniref:hypothetical protein n=1 Tax=Caballeronia novacaledonica TaxID=1544861 RepID=UPI003CCBD6A3